MQQGAWPRVAQQGAWPPVAHKRRRFERLPLRETQIDIDMRGESGSRHPYPQRVASWEDVSRLALALPQTREEVRREHRVWTVKDKYFVWERPLRESDRKALGDAAPEGPILGAATVHGILAGWRAQLQGAAPAVEVR